MNNKEKLIIIEKLKEYILKHKGCNYDPEIEDCSDFDLLCMFGDAYTDEDLNIIIEILKLFEDSNILGALELFDSFMHPKMPLMQDYFNEQIKLL